LFKVCFSFCNKRRIQKLDFAINAGVDY